MLKGTLKAITFSVLVGLLAACSSGTASEPTGSQEETLKIGVRQDSPPFSSVDPATNIPEGFEVDLANAMLKYLPYDKIEFVPVTGETRIPMLEQGDVDMVMATLSITEERKQIVNFSRPYFPAALGILVKEGSKISNPVEIDGKIACQPKGTLGAQIIDQKVDEVFGAVTFETVELRTYPECVLALKQGRVDFIGTDYGTLEGLAEQSDGVTILDAFIPGFPFAAGVAKTNIDLVKKIDEALLATFKDGSWLTIHKKWVGEGIPEGWPPAK